MIGEQCWRCRSWKQWFPLVKNHNNNNNDNNNTNHRWIPSTLMVSLIFYFVLNNILYSTGSSIFGSKHQNLTLVIAPTIITKTTTTTTPLTTTNTSLEQNATIYWNSSQHEQQQQQQHYHPHDLSIDDTLPPLYSYARSDRSGAAIQDMLMCHAYAYHLKRRYGGACTHHWDDLLQYRGKRPDREHLLQVIGLDTVLPLACPPGADGELKVVNRKLYIQNDTHIFTRDYQQYLQSLVHYPTTTTTSTINDDTNNNNNSTEFRIAVHIRRGDIDPCRPRTRGYPRYLPNQHFLKLIDRYIPEQFKQQQQQSLNNLTNSSLQNQNQPNILVNVTIYSESSSYESFDVFYQQGYNVVLDGDIGNVWKGILTSHVVILSRSSFSLVPAILSKGTIVYTPFWHDPLPDWHIVDDELLNETQIEFRRLKSTCPPKNNKKK